MFNNLKLSFVIKEIRTSGQLRYGVPSLVVFTTLSVIKFTVYIQDFVLKRYYHGGCVSDLALAQGSAHFF